MHSSVHILNNADDIANLLSVVINIINFLGFEFLAQVAHIIIYKIVKYTSRRWR